MGIDIAAVGVVVLLVLGWRSTVGRRARNVAQQKLSHVLDRTENPVEALDLAYRKQLEALASVRRGVADVVTSQKRLEIQASQLKQSQDKLQEQARLALQQGREDLARLALTRAQAAKLQLTSLEPQIAQLQEQEQKLEVTAQRLQTRVDGFRTQRDTLKAQYSAAQASAKVGETVTGISKDTKDVALMLDRARDNIQQMQARSSAIDQLISSGALEAVGDTGGDDIDRQLQAASSDAEIEAGLARLRQETLSDSTHPPAITGGGEDQASKKGGPGS